MAMNTSVFHPVPVILQSKEWACWYTSLQIVVRYCRGRGSGGGLRDPSEVAETQQMYLSDQGIGAGPEVGGVPERERIANLLGFSVVYASLTEEGLWDLIRANPVIYSGQWIGEDSGHWVVFNGISMDTISVTDPAAGRENWNYQQFVTNYLVQTADRPFIHVP